MTYVGRRKSGFDELKWFRKHLLEIEMTKKTKTSHYIYIIIYYYYYA